MKTLAAIAVLLLAFSGGCAELTKKRVTCAAIANSWIGSEIDHAVIQLGPPTGEKKLKGGGVVMAWEETSSSYVRGIGGSHTQSLILAADKDGIIRETSYPGCRDR